MSLASFKDLATLDRLVSEPARLAILTALTACQKADFRSLTFMTGLAQGNLSGHLQKLEKGRLITIDKQFKGKYPQTWLEVTVAGRSALQEHWRRIETSKTEAKSWRAPAGLEMRMDDASDPSPCGSASTSTLAADLLRDARRLAEDRLVDAVLGRHGGDRLRAAEELGISLSTLKRKLRRQREPPSA
jgi:DNA-binding transcriptional ArsR family regulator